MTYPDMNYKLGQARAQQQHEAYMRWVKENQDEIRQLNEATLRRQAEAIRNMHANPNYRNQSFNQRQSTFNHAPQQPVIPNNHWSRVLEIKPDASVAEIKSAYRQKAKAAHADAGGSDSEMSRLNVARDQAIKERQPR